MELDTQDNVKEYLIESCISTRTDEIVVERLSGGVSSIVWRIALNNNRWVLKQSLGKLNVEDDWFSDVDRIHREHMVMNAIGPFVPVPKILYIDNKNHIYIMEFVEGAQSWKDILMEGIFNVSVAENVGRVLHEIHVNSITINARDKVEFQNQKYFIQLRIDPFHRCLMQKYPALFSSIQKLITEVTYLKTCLVHGDFSPKNILVKKDNNVILIDFEVAHWGNPVFDLAYCIGHLMLKGWYLNKPEQILKLIKVFLAGYGGYGTNLIPHLGLMLLARIDGKSKVEYIKEENMKNVIRNVAIPWINNKIEVSDTLENICNAYTE
jgi:aminoglycoside phosphotransferase (APT) family kinase protein